MMRLFLAPQCVSSTSLYQKHCRPHDVAKRMIWQITMRICLNTRFQCQSHKLMANYEVHDINLNEKDNIDTSFMKLSMNAVDPHNLKNLRHLVQTFCMKIYLYHSILPMLTFEANGAFMPLDLYWINIHILCL